MVNSEKGFGNKETFKTNLSQWLGKERSENLARSETTTYSIVGHPQRFRFVINHRLFHTFM